MAEQNYLLNNTSILFNNQLSVVAVYEEKCVPGKVVNYFYDKARDSISIHYVLAGKGIIYLSGRSHVIEKRQSFYVPPYEVVKYIADLANPWHYVWIEIKGKLAESIASYIGYSKHHPVISLFSNEVQSIFFTMLERKLTHEMDDLEFMSDLFLLIKALRNDHEPISGLRSKHLQDAFTYIHNNYMNNISLEDIAKNVGLNAKYLTRVFNTEVSTTPIKYLRDLRIKEAEKLLRETKFSIKEIATRTGFLDPLYFSKAFRQYHNVSPKEYRRLLQ